MQTDVTPPGAPPRVTDRILVLGGARSGKSWFAEMLASAGGVVDYLATSARDTDDPEWEARVVAHQRRRPPRCVHGGSRGDAPTSPEEGAAVGVPWSIVR